MQDHWSLQENNRYPYKGVYGPGGERVLRLITLATPHYGSPVANKPFRDDYVDRWDAENPGNWSFTVDKFENTACSSDIDSQLPYDEPTRSDLHWDNSLVRFSYLSSPATSNGTVSDHQRDRNDWLQSLNCVYPFNKSDNHNCTTTNYASKIIAYGGVSIDAVTHSSATTWGVCIQRYGFSPSRWPLCVLSTLLDTVFSMSSDGAVPFDSAVYKGKIPSNQRRAKPGYNHIQMVEGKTGWADSLFAQIKDDLLAALPVPDAPVARFTMSHEGRTGTQDSPLVVTVPKGGSATVAFSSVGSAASYEWRIDSTVRTVPSFSLSLAAGTHEVRLKVTDSLGQIGVAVGRVIIQEESPPAVLPGVVTVIASQVTNVSAVLNGIVTPNAPSATAWFQWGITTSYGLSSLPETVEINTPTFFSRTIFGLSPNTTYHFRLVARNNADINYGLDQTFTTPSSVDTAAPSISITSPTSGPTYSTIFSGVSLAGTASDNRAVSVVNWVNDRGGSGTANGTTSWTIPSVSLSPGANVITVTAWDASGNSQNDTLTVTYDQPDNVSPETEILSGPSGTWPSSSFMFTWTGSDNVTPTANLLYTTYLEGYNQSSTLYSSATSRSFSGIPNGTYTFSVRARDAAENIDYTAATHTFTVNEPDLVSPTVTSFFLGGGGDNNDLFRTGREYPIAFEVTDNIQAVEADLYYSLTGGAPWTPIIAGISVRFGQNVFDWTIPVGAATANGALRLVVRDAAGNAGEATFSPFTVRDGTLPVVRVVTPNGGDIWPLGSTQTIHWTVSGTSPIRQVRIRFLRDNTEEPIATLDGSITSYAWTLPTTRAANKALMQVIVEDINGNQNEDFSDSFFTIADPDAPPPPPWHIPALATTIPPPPHSSARQSIRDPSIAAEQSGALHLAAVYEEDDQRDGPGNTYYQQQVVYRARRNGVWGPQVQITDYPPDVRATGSGALYVIKSAWVAVDPSGRPHVIWIRGQELEHPSYNDDLFYSYFDGSSWTEPINLSASVTSGDGSSTRYPAITVDSNGHVHVIWTERVFPGTEKTTYHTIKTGQSWSVPTPINLPASDWPSILADTSGNVHLATTCDCTAATVHHNKFDGIQWSSMPIADNLPGINQYAHLALGDDGRLHATWRSIRQDPVLGGFSVSIHYSAFDEQNWGPVETVQGGFLDTGNQGSTIVINGLKPMVFWLRRMPVPGNSNGILFVQFSERTEAGWSPPVQISDRTTLVASSTPVVAASGGIETHVVWAGTGGIIWNYMAGATLTVTKSGTGTGTIKTSSAGIDCGTVCQASLNSNAEITLEITSAADSTFADWDGDADCSDGQVTMDADKTCTAIFNLRPPPASITVAIPNGGETWTVGTTQTIQWTSSGVSGDARIELSRDGGTLWTTLFSSTANDGTENWQVTSPGATQAQIRISSVTAPGIVDTSDANFTISDVAILSPNGGESWAIGTTQTIQWTSSGVSGNVKIEFSQDGGQSWTPLFSDTANDGAQSWSVTGPATTQARIRVSSVTTPSVTDSSDANFTITQICSYALSPTSQSFSASDSAGNVSVTTQSGCSWTAKNNAGWVTVTSGSPGNGNGTVNYSVTANPNITPRDGTLTIAGQTFTVQQNGSCLYSGTVVRVTTVPGNSPSTIYVRTSALSPVFFSSTTSDAKLINAALHALKRQTKITVAGTATTCPAATAGGNIGTMNFLIVNP